MIYLLNFRWLLFHIVFVQLNFSYVRTSWPSSNGSSIYLFGLFPDAENVSESTELSVHCRAMFKSAILLSQVYNITIQGEYIEWQSAQTGGNGLNGLSDTCQSVSSSNIVGIVGPAYSREAHLIADFGKRIGIPVISYGATDPDLSDRNRYPNFYRTVPSDNTAALAILKLFVRFNWTSCLIIYQNDAFGSNGAKAINELFINNDLTVTQLIVFDIATLKIRGDLQSCLLNSATRIVLVWAESNSTSLILENALNSNVVGPEFTWILSSSISLNSFNETFQENLIGMVSIEPVTGIVVGAPINSTLLNAAYQIWKQYEPESFPQSTKVNPYALFAFDATWSLIQSLQQFCSLTQNNSSSCLSFIGSSFCFNRRFVDSESLLNILNSIEFLGVSGRIQFSVNVTDRINGSYFYAQNAQPSSNGVSFVPVLEYTDPDNWKAYPGENVIVWPGNSLIEPSDRALLAGVTLRIVVIESPPYTIVSNVLNSSGENVTQLIGYMPDLIELLRNQMGFIPDIQLAPSNQTYSQIVQSVADGVYDIVVGDVTVTSQRKEIVDFSNSISDSSLRIIMRTTPTATVDLLSYLNPFSRGLWLTLLVACVFASMLLCLIEREENEALQTRSICSQIVMSLWYSFGNIVGYGVDFNASTAAGRLITFGLYILSLVLVASYTANLASDLTISKSQNIINGIDDIKNGKIPFNRIGIIVGTAFEQFYLSEISDGSRNFYPLESKQELYDDLLAGRIDAAFIDTGSGEYITNTIYCNLTLIGADFYQSIHGIVTQKQWLYAQEIDVNILLLRESGSLDNLRQKWFQTTICPDETQTSTAMGIQSMAGLFLTFAIIIVLTLLLFAWKKRWIFLSCLKILKHRNKGVFRKRNYTINHPDKTSNQTQKSSFPSSNLSQV